MPRSGPRLASCALKRCAAVFSILGYLYIGLTASAQEPIKLFRQSAQITTKKEIMRRQGTELLGLVNLNADALARLAARPTDAMELVINLGETLNLSLDVPGGADMRANLTSEGRAEPRDHIKWAGRISGVDDSSVTFAYFEGAAAGSIRLPNATIKIRRVEGDVYAVEKINAQDFPDEDHPAVSPKRKSGLIRKNTTAQCESDPTIKKISVLMLYTDAAVLAAGSDQDLRTILYDVVGEANLAARNSDVRVEFSIAHLQKAAISKGKRPPEYLDNLTKDASIKKLRDLHRAHIVSLLDDLHQPRFYCGIGHVMRDLVSPDRSVGYNIVDFSCAWDNLSWIHEVGHNFGAAHNSENAESSGLFGYSYGQRWPNRFRSIMAYKCNDATPCNRLARFTNPRIVYSGVTIGDASLADNARTLNQSRCAVAGWY
jgi:Metallo-peptidase family M12